MMATGQIASNFAWHISDAAVDTDCDATKAARFPPSLIVTPVTSMVFSGPKGGPFSPSLIENRVSASTGDQDPILAHGQFNLGATDTSGVTIKLTVNASASSLPPGAYGPGIAFTNVSNGQGSATTPAKLIIQASSPPRPRVKSRVTAEGTTENTCWATAAAAYWRSEYF
jgi:hypothetical protein